MRPLFQYRTLFVPARRKESAGRKVFHSDIGKQLMNSQITETVFFQQSQGVTPYPLPATVYDSNPGEFFIFFPRDWHIAKVANDTSDQAIRVIVVKVDYVE